jgi:hypothetical protein
MKITTVKSSLATATRDAQDYAATLSGPERFHFDCWLSDLIALRHQLLQGSPYRVAIPTEISVESEEALDNHSTVKAFTERKVA